MQFCPRYQLQLQFQRTLLGNPTANTTPPNACKSAAKAATERYVARDSSPLMTRPTRPFCSDCRTKVQRFFQTKPPHLCEVCGVYCPEHSALCLLQPRGALLLAELYSRWARPSAPYFRQTARSTGLQHALHAWLLWRGPEIIMCCQSMLQTDLPSRRRVIDPFSPMAKMDLLPPPNRSSGTAPIIIAQPYG